MRGGWPRFMPGQHAEAGHVATQQTAAGGEGLSYAPPMTGLRRSVRGDRLRRTAAAALALATVLASGCASYSTIRNRPLADGADRAGYVIATPSADDPRSGDVTLILAFSGGGARAAALAYGVLLELRDTPVRLQGRSRRLLDEVDVITSVSGGSFTAAHFGLYGDRTFETFEHDFLRRNAAAEIRHALFNPLFWFSRRSRSELVVDYYERAVFKGATFADLQRAAGPRIVINATDLGGGVRFSFTQEYFDLLCSDLASFPLARAVTASSAVPVLFTPVVVENFDGCGTAGFEWLDRMRRRVAGSPDLSEVIQGLRSYADKDRRRYIHLIDGGVTDNLGLRALYEYIEVGGGIETVLQRMERKPAPRFAIISVNASTRPATQMEASARAPTLEQTIDAVTDVQLHRYNAATLEQMQASMHRWSEALSTPSLTVEPYFVRIDFSGIPQTPRRRFLNQIPTSLSIEGDHVDALIQAGRELLRDNAEFRRFVADLGR